MQLPQIEKMKPDFDNALYNWCFAMYTAHAKGKTLQEVINMTSELQNYMVLDPGFRQFCERYNFVAADPQTQKEYVNWVKDLMREQGLTEAAWLNGVEEGREFGRELGRVEGRKEGREEGRVEGREEQRLEIARQLFSMNIEVQDIIKATGLSAEKVRLLGD